jgi:hypothetical protein
MHKGARACEKIKRRAGNSTRPSIVYFLKNAQCSLSWERPKCCSSAGASTCKLTCAQNGYSTPSFVP